MYDIKTKAREWAELNKTDYEGYGDPLCEDYEPPDLERMGIAAYLAGAKERDRWWAESYHESRKLIEKLNLQTIFLYSQFIRLDLAAEEVLEDG